jgi:hypothetical protein
MAWISRYHRLYTIFERTERHLGAFIDIAFISILSSQPRCFAGIISAMRVKVMGSSPPADAPIRKHITRFHSKLGITPQMAVPMNISADSRIAARRPKESARRPHRIDPAVVPISAVSGRNRDLRHFRILLDLHVVANVNRLALDHAMHSGATLTPMQRP